MKKYTSFFRLRFSMGLQYRTAAIAGLITQFAWGFLNIIAYRAFYKSNPAAFPMEFSAIVAYIWLYQAFLSIFNGWVMESEIFDSIINGNIAYELCRPVNIYNVWFFRSMANRLSKAVLRCSPILIVSVLLPEPYRLLLPSGFTQIVFFLAAMTAGFLVTVSLCMLIYMLTFFTISSQGLWILYITASEFFSGAIIPLPFFPDKLRAVMELLPFASMQNVPLLIYSGELNGSGMVRAVIIQMIWIILLVVFGKGLYKSAATKVVLQGG